MSEYNVNIVIGANFGDEGKGYVSNALSANKKTLTILPTGGSQRAHTVDCNNKYYNGRHVYHHFASGTMNGSDTYYGVDFVLNPMEYVREAKELDEMYNFWELRTNQYASPKCYVTTPFDMFLNQIKEEYRGEGKHGTCGYGVWETIKRNQNSQPRYCLNYEELYHYLSRDYLAKKGIEPIRKKLIDIRDGYFKGEIERHHITLSNEWKHIVYDDRIIQHWIMDAKRMCWCIECVDVSYAISKCKPKNIIFEFGQGILLDCDNLEYAPHLTCAKTGLDGINQLWNKDYKLILNDAKNVNAYYVTRTYLTRHGIGRLDSECTRNDISDKMEEDKTNVPNPFQNHLRYAPLDYDSLARRIFIDNEVYNVDVNIVFTHCNELPVKLEELNNAIQGYFESNVRIYEQFSEKESFENLKNYFLRPLDKA